MDLQARLTALGSDFPKIWFTLGLSGDKISTVILKSLDPSFLADVTLVRASYDRKSNNITLRDGAGWPTFAEDPILLIDSAVHSGASMSMAADALYRNGAKNVISYSLIVKRTSDFIPNYFGMLIGEHDRALFQLERLPNNRLQIKRPFGRF